MEDKGIQIKEYIDNQFATSKFNLSGLIKDMGVTNYVNKVAKAFGFNNIVEEDNQLFNELNGFVRTKIKEGNQPMKNQLTEAPVLTTNVNMLNYEDSDVIKIIKAKFNGEFKEYKLDKIVADTEGPFYTLEVTGTANSDVKHDLELKRFSLHQLLNNFKGSFMSSVSEVLPVVNVKIASYQFTKNCDKIKFGVILLLSNTNNRDWVTGAIQPIDEEEREKTLKEAKLHELRVKSNLVPIPLMQAINSFKSNQINRRMLETAIKACKRNELEKYVMDTLNLKIDSSSDEKEDEKDENSELEEVAMPENESADTLTPQMFQEFQYDFNWEQQAVKYMRDKQIPKETILAVIQALHGPQYFDDGGSVIG